MTDLPNPAKRAACRGERPAKRSCLLAAALLALAIGRADAQTPGTTDRASEVERAGRLPRPVVVDKVVAFVGSRPITLSEVELELRLERAANGDVTGASGLVTLEQLADLLPILMERTVVLRGMRTQYPDTLEPGVVEREVARMRSLFSSPEAWDAFLARLELTEDEVRERRRRVLEAGSILDAAVNDALTVKRGDLEAYLATHPGVTREQAEKELLAASEAVVRDELLERKKKDLQASIVDSIVGAPQ